MGEASASETFNCFDSRGTATLGSGVLQATTGRSDTVIGEKLLLSRLLYGNLVLLVVQCQLDQMDVCAIGYDDGRNT